MRLLKYGILFGGLLMFISCATSQHSIIGNYKSYSELLQLTVNNTFKYRNFSVVSGSTWAYGQWKRIGDNKVQLISVKHDSIPIKVFEQRCNIEDRLIILPNRDRYFLETNLFIQINGNNYKIAKDCSVLKLSKLKFPKIETIALVAFEDGKLRTERAYTYLRTSVYQVKNNENNVFYVDFLQDDLFGLYHLWEIDDTITIKKNSLIWNGQKFKVMGRLMFD